MAYPVTVVTMPSSLVGQPNGKLPDALLVTPGFPGRPHARLHSHTARAWNALTAEVAARFGETLSVTSTVDAYRTYLTQEATFRARYQTAYLSGRPTKVWNGVTWYQKPNTAMAAVPGTSNHGYGLAIDACLWRNNTITGITANGPMFTWLLANAARYGFSWEAQSEPWHIRYVSGDRIPQAVLDYERPPVVDIPNAPDDDLEDPMLLVRHVDGRMFYTDMKHDAVYVTEDEGAMLRDKWGASVAPDSGPWPLNALESSVVERMAAKS
jgi:hypothetical protein